MLNEKELLFEDIKHYSIILDDYINKRYKYTINTEYLEDEIKVIFRRRNKSYFKLFNRNN